jgi:hypothetical protein
MTTELWGTFSVRDHMVDRAFIADVLLYDRLVIPTLPEADPETEWPVEWDLKKQKTLLADLGHLAIPVPWTKERRSEWQKRFDDQRPEERRVARANATQIIGQDVAMARDPQYADLPYRITRNLLQDFVNDVADDQLFKKLRVTNKLRPGSSLEAVSAYPSYDAFATDVSLVGTAEKGENLHRLAPTEVFGWEFFIPDSADFGVDEDRRLLEKAMRLATKEHFIRWREEFYGWWSDASKSGMTSAEAKADMEKRIAEYHEVVKEEGWLTAVRYMIKILDAFSGSLGLVNKAASTGAEVFFGSADVFADALLKQENAPDRLKVAAIFHDARTRFGWKARN